MVEGLADIIGPGPALTFVWPSWILALGAAAPFVAAAEDGDIGQGGADGGDVFVVGDAENDGPLGWFASSSWGKVALREGDGGSNAFLGMGAVYYVASAVGGMVENLAAAHEFGLAEGLVGDGLVVGGVAEEGSGSDEGSGGVGVLVVACQAQWMPGDEVNIQWTDLVVRGHRGEIIGDSRGGLRALFGNIEGGIGAADTEFLAGDVSDGGAQDIGVIEAQAAQAYHFGIQYIGAVEATTQANFTNKVCF